MNKKILLLETLLALLLVLGFRFATKQQQGVPAAETRSSLYKARQVMNCSPDWNFLNIDSLAAAMKPLPGWGDYAWPIASTSDSARFYFNQGINMYYAFHIIESMASFKKAQLFDDKNPMVYWAQALAYGPNINDFAYATVPDAIHAAEKAANETLPGRCHSQSLNTSCGA